MLSSRASSADRAEWASIGGAIQQTGTPREVYKTPSNTFIAQFIGSPSMNLLPLEAGRLGGATVTFGEEIKAQRDGALIGFRPENVSFDAGTGDVSEYPTIRGGSPPRPAPQKACT